MLKPAQPYHCHAQHYVPAADTPECSSATRMGKALARALYTAGRYGLMLVGAVAIAMWTYQGAIA